MAGRGAERTLATWEGAGTYRRRAGRERAYLRKRQDGRTIERSRYLAWRRRTCQLCAASARAHAGAAAHGWPRQARAAPAPTTRVAMHCLPASALRAPQRKDYCSHLHCKCTCGLVAARYRHSSPWPAGYHLRVPLRTTPACRSGTSCVQHLHVPLSRVAIVARPGL